MARRSIRDPRVQFAIAKRLERKQRRESCAAVLLELDRGPLTLQELATATGMTRHECSVAVDRLRIDSEVELVALTDVALVKRRT